MNIEHLRYFLAAAKYLNFSRAADALFVHPTTMSRCITGMEEELGAPLFNRLKYSLQLTEMGAQFRVEAEAIVERYDRMLQRAKKAADSLKGRLSLLTPELYYQMLADAYARFYHRNPNVEFAVDVCPFSKMDTLCQAVTDGVVDMCITFSQNFHDDNGELERLEIFREEQMLTVPINHPLSGRESCSLAELNNTTFLLADHLGKENLQRLIGRVDRKRNTVQLMHSTSGEALLLRFTAGLGVMLMPAIVAKNSGGNFSSMHIEDFDAHFEVYLVWKRDNKNPAIEAFLDCVKQTTPLLHPVSTSSFKQEDGA